MVFARVAKTFGDYLYVQTRRRAAAVERAETTRAPDRSSGGGAGGRAGGKVKNGVGAARRVSAVVDVARAPARNNSGRGKKEKTGGGRETRIMYARRGSVNDGRRRFYSPRDRPDILVQD